MHTRGRGWWTALMGWSAHQGNMECTYRGGMVAGPPQVSPPANPQEAQSRLLDKESEMGRLRDALAQLSPGRGVAGDGGGETNARPVPGGRVLHHRLSGLHQGAGRLAVALPSSMAQVRRCGVPPALSPVIL